MLTQDQIDFYRENGFLHVQAVLSPEEAAFYRARTHALADRLVAKGPSDATWGSARELGDDAKKTELRHCHDVQFYDAAFGQLLLNDRVTAPVSQLIGPNIQLHHTKMFIKPPEKGSPFPMHQDQPYFPHDRHSMVAAIIHFDDAPIEKGCVRVVPGSHKLGPLDHISEGGWHLPLSEYPIESAVPVPAKAGDMLIFSYLTIHGSGINVSSEARTTLLIQMRDPEDPPSVETHQSRGQGTMLRGIDPTNSAWRW